MSLRNKTISIVSLTFLALIIILRLVFNHVVMDGFLHLERASAELNIERAKGLLEQERNRIAERLGDWANWDDTYQFVSNHNQSYIDLNLHSAAVELVGVDVLLFFDRDGKQIYAVEHDLPAGAPSILEDLEKELKPGSRILHPASDNEYFKGILLLPRGPVIVAAKSILTSELKGPANGTIIFVKKINHNFITKLAHLARINLDIATVRPEELLNDNVAAQVGKLSITFLSSSMLKAETVIEDVFGQPALRLAITIPRSIYQQGAATYRTLMIAAMIVALVFAAITLVLLERSFLHRLKMLGNEVLRIKENADFSARVNLGGSDELALFARHMNEMLEALSRSEQRLEITKAQLERDIERRIKLEEEQARLEEQLRQSQKMEAIGRLAGGVAHDFNNILTGIIGYVDVLMHPLPQESELRADLDEIGKAAEQGAALTRQLLAFSRKQLITPTVVNMNKILDDSQKMLRRLAGEDIDLRIMPAESLANVKIDPSQVRQILVNLLANARDAMPSGGQVTIQTSNEVLDVSFCEHQTDLKPGGYVSLVVTDTGLGMEEEVLRHIFEPFYTTKEKGKGSGLGLAMVYGIVIQNHGCILVDSKLEGGTSFRVYLPRTDEPIAASEKVQITVQLTGHETIMLVEDDERVRKLTKRLLDESGYHVIVAENGAEALKIEAQFAGKIDLLLTDVVMPKVNGKELYDQLHSRRPLTKVLFMSGYTHDVIANRGVLDKQLQLIEKPFTGEALLVKIREVLGRPSQNSAPATENFYPTIN